jgi:creatinine amidohydrolase
MHIYKLDELKYPELDSFPRDKTLFTIVVSPLEEHGPHLPLGVDNYNAQYFAQEIGRKFLTKHPDWRVVEIPSLFIGSFAFEAPGTVTVSSRTIRKLLVEYLSSLARYGFRYFLISNAHGGPTHIVALEEAARIVSRRFGCRVVSFSGQLIWDLLRGAYWQEIQKQFSSSEEDAQALKQDAHAGQWETSMMLKLRPDLVDPIYKELKPFTVEPIRKLRPNYPLRMGDKLGYVGHPARASKELGDISSDFLVERALAFVEEDLLSARVPKPSIFYRILVFRTNFLPFLLTLLLLAALLIYLIFF